MESETTPLQVATAAPVVAPATPVVDSVSTYTRYYNEDRCGEMKLGAVTPYHAALALLVLFETEAAKNPAYGKALLAQFSRLASVAETFVELCNAYWTTDFADATFLWDHYQMSPSRNSKEVFDPEYHLHYSEMSVTLDEASLFQLVKTLRLHFAKMTLKMFGPRQRRNRDTGEFEERTLSSDNVSINGRMSDSLSAFADKLLGLYPYFDKLSNSLEEVKNGLQKARASVPREKRVEKYTEKEHTARGPPKGTRTVKVGAVVSDTGDAAASPTDAVGGDTTEKSTTPAPVAIPSAPAKNPWAERNAEAAARKAEVAARKAEEAAKREEERKARAEKRAAEHAAEPAAAGAGAPAPVDRDWEVAGVGKRVRVEMVRDGKTVVLWGKTNEAGDVVIGTASRKQENKPRGKLYAGPGKPYKA